MSKYQEVYLRLAGSIVSGEFSAGSRMPSVSALAQEYNISYMTANKVYDLLCRNRLVESRPRQGFFVRSLIKEDVDFDHKLEVGKVGLLLSMGDTIYNDFCNQLVLRLFRAGHAPLLLGCSWMMQDLSYEGARELLLSYAGAGVETLIIRGDASFPYGALWDLREKFRKIIFVMFYAGDMPFVQADKVLFDMCQAGRLAAEYLIENKFNKLAFLSQEPLSEEVRSRYSVKSKLFDLEMLDGIEDACRDHGFDFYENGEIITFNMPCSVPEKVRERIIGAVDRGCNGFICMNDIRALMVYQIAAEQGWRINKDIGITGNFNTSICESLTPQLTSVDLNVSMLVEGVINALAVNNGNKSVYVQPNIIKRK